MPITRDRIPVTTHLLAHELHVLTEICQHRDLTEDALLRAALREYADRWAREMRGEKLQWLDANGAPIRELSKRQEDCGNTPAPREGA